MRLNAVQAMVACFIACGALWAVVLWLVFA